jgi:amino acid permease
MYAKESSDAQWSKFSIVIIAIIFQITWFIVLSYFRNRISFAFAGILASISFIIPILRIYEINNLNVKIGFLIITCIIIGIILWVSIEFIIYEKFITYGWIVSYYAYPIYLAIYAGLFVQFLRINEDGEGVT